ncbi:TnsD family Tn7-like transposition protein [Clostridium estertheticum]|uniref:TnsD family Tn7-like transposition protein n=1 Tax=Clostridium estertheticum TaxID=238834 RepID=UPI001CF5EDE5|nr:TnsD family Tn7-like transposition protein [Clostridium estertheticum]MCB2353136.1 hypothetical protein [Clostridium estertheticum]WAG43376.1 hypothetical protein LL065_01840 [Clostridium estertheticum]
MAYGVEYLLDNCLINYNMKRVHDKYIELLNNRGLVTLKGRVKQRELYEKLISFYPTELLTLLNSSINFNSECNWLKVALRKPRQVIHPIRNILIILFLSKKLESFFKEESYQCSKQVLFPCLNPACENYRKLSIKKYDISIESKTNEKIGTFYCKCEFVYSRKMEADIYVVGRVKKYGVTWETKLKGLISEGKYSTRGIALILRCDSKTVVRYADKLGMKHLLNTNMNVAYDVINASSKRVNSENYKVDIKNIIIENPMIIRKQVRESLNKQYMWLYKNDREWFGNNMPKKQNTNGNNNNNPAPWNDRDNKTLELLINEDNMLITSNDNARITKSLLGRKIGMLGMLEKNLDKLPKTQEYLSEIIESVEDFQIRRVNNICLKTYENGQILAKWKIIRQAGLRPNYSVKVDEQIDSNILKYNKLKE